MRRSVLRTKAAQAIIPNPQRCLHQSLQTICPDVGTLAGTEQSATQRKPHMPFRFETGFALFAKRQPRPFPPPFLSPPSVSYSDPLSTHHRSRDRRPLVNGSLIRGHTNGDDAIYASDIFIGANDGVGAWSTRPCGHAGLWSRLVLHFWALEVEQDAQRMGQDENYVPNPVDYLQRAYEKTIQATSEPNAWQGTTTATGAQLFYKKTDSTPSSVTTPLLYVTNLGDSQVLVLRPQKSEVIYKTKEQWHWFDCPRQLGTNSPDTPLQNAVVDQVKIQEDDVVLAMSDGVIDNLWEHEIVDNVVTSIRHWEMGQGGESTGDRQGGGGGGMSYVADRLVHAAKVIATDPFAESPFMEHAVEEGLAMEGGKLDDISVVAALCKRNPG
ncbi:phosphatase 2C-like domain-containing protein [Calycina marina]|uniref:Protein phosphatase n=1 Tax=Calycina marina TaxID=1763456 RepID=A0A9P7YXI8_9HELO|nr:phosphatase 2C-like domain-containing protein [Calycina marina]